jgi:hypothetical protein
MTLVKDNNSKQSDKVIVTQKPNIVKVDDVAKAKTAKRCDCPNSEPGKVKLDIEAHQYGCHFRKKLQTGQFTVNTSVTPKKINDGYSLGIVLGEEGF